MVTEYTLSGRRVTPTDTGRRYVPASDYAALEAELDRVNATLDRLREAVPEGNWIYVCSEIRLLRVVVAVRKLLYPKETDNG